MVCINPLYEDAQQLFHNTVIEIEKNEFIQRGYCLRPYLDPDVLWVKIFVAQAFWQTVV